ncbi:MAG TPA: DUF935 family protein [Bacteroidales bacterium]|nr:DUF935 family protein [Bacteroidales bacterium]HSA43583.1 DUF935 family protein [Bacteroidales bacterium]
MPTATNKRNPVKTPQKPKSATPDRIIRVEAKGAPSQSVSKVIEPIEFSPKPKELRDWQQAITIAGAKMNPTRYLLIDLYLNLINDNHLFSVMESRILRVIRSKFKIVDEKTQKEDLEKTALLQKPWFDKYMREAMMSVFFGTTVLEISELDEEGMIRTITSIPRQNIKPLSGLIVKNYSDDKGWNYKDPPLAAYYIQVGEDNDLGLISRIGPTVIYKKYCMGAWSHYVEKYGIPFRWIITDSSDPKRLQALNSMMEAWAGAGYAILQNGETLETLTVNSSQHNIFDDFIRRVNSEISKAILGQDGTTDNKDATGTYGSIKVLMDVANDRHSADRQMIKNNINHELLPRLIENFAYPLAGYHFDWDDSQEMDRADFITAVKDLASMFELDPLQITEKTGINILSVKKQSTPQLPAQGEDPEDDPEPEPEPPVPPKPPQKKKPSNLNLRLPDYPAGDPRPLALDQQDIASIEEQVLLGVFNNSRLFDPEYYRYLARELTAGLLQGWNSHPFEYSDMDHSVLTMMEANIFRFSAAKDMALLQQLNELITDATTFDDFKKKAEPLLKSFNLSYMRTEFDTAVGTGINAARYREQLSQSDVLKYWKYQTAGDNRVRESHQALDGKILPANDAAWNTIYPPNGWHCRCEVIAISEPGKGEKVANGDNVIQLLQTSNVDQHGNSELDRMIKSGFGINRGNLALVFNENQVYIKGFDARFNINDMYGDENEEHSWENLPKHSFTSRSSTLQNNEQAAEWFRQKAMDKKYLVMEDYQGRPIRLTEQTFKRHFNDQQEYKDRYQLLEFMPEVLKNPDEVWVTGRGGASGFTHSYVKFYQDDMLIVVTDSMSNTPVRVKTIMDVKGDQFRRGLLIKKYTGQG